MTAVRKPKAASQPSSAPFYTIKRDAVGFYVASIQDGEIAKVSEPDLWVIAVNQLKNIIKKDLGI